MKELKDIFTVGNIKTSHFGSKQKAHYYYEENITYKFNHFVPILPLKYSNKINDKTTETELCSFQKRKIFVAKCDQNKKESIHNWYTFSIHSIVS